MTRDQPYFRFIGNHFQVKNCGIACKASNGNSHILSMLVDIFNDLDLSKSHYQFSDDSRASVVNNCNDQGRTIVEIADKVIMYAYRLVRNLNLILDHIIKPLFASNPS